MLSNNIYQEDRIPGQFERFWRSYRTNSLAMFGLWCFVILVIITLSASLLVPHDPLAQTNHLLQPPSWSHEGSVEYFLGTDDIGRDILSRLLMGAQLTFGSGMIVMFIATFIGCTIGIFAGMTKGLLSSTLNHLLDTVMSIPSLLLAIIFVAFLGSGELNILLAITLALIPRFIRSVYLAVNSEIEKDYNIAARLDGANNFHLLWSSILPNLTTVIAAEMTMAASIAILDISALGFLGLGAQAPSPEWGTMLGDSVDLIYLAPWTVTLPGLFIMFSVIIINLVGEGIRQALSSGTE
ncbi:ABC transporter permease subunit [Vibrio rumoiensis]|uniref:Peptide ABC transporter permease n=1 Tax=Vibrio rumoiensis 1S-45 TaxID=1188252 RepID=A0A1E5E457_9VIBR|nr:ABC transporter permease subunit [Vibrio rumoiensis]OEF27461.1 peptide ABC transporter permease [Vibrio rumoiensis 1S-45]